MQKLFKSLAFCSLGALIMLPACGGGEQQNDDGKTEQDTGSTIADKQEEDGDWSCSAAKDGFTVEYVEGTIIQNPSVKNGYLQFSAIDVPLAYDSYLKRDKPSSYPYNYILVEIFAENGKNYPISTGTYELGGSDSEKNVHTCVNCVTLGVDLNKNDTPSKKLFAVEGSVTITSLEEGKIYATLKNAYFKEYHETYDESGEPLSATFVENGLDWCVDKVIFDGTSFEVYQGR